jgi:hypothetical protein
MLDAIPPVIDVVTKGTDWPTIVTGITGVAGIIGTYWQGKRAREATSKDLRDSLQADADRALRADRRGVYARYLAVINKTLNYSSVFESEWTAAGEDDTKRRTLRSAVGATLSELYAAAAEVKLIAPDVIGDAATAKSDSYTEYFNAVITGDTTRADALSENLGKFPVFKDMRADLALSADRSSPSSKGEARLRDATSPPSS